MIRMSQKVREVWLEFGLVLESEKRIDFWEGILVALYPFYNLFNKYFLWKTFESDGLLQPYTF